MTYFISEQEFARDLRAALMDIPEYQRPAWVTGPGRTGALAAAYTAGLLQITFVSFGARTFPGGQPLIIDARPYGAKSKWTIKKLYQEHDPLMIVLYDDKDSRLWCEKAMPRHPNVKIFPKETKPC